MQVGLFLDESCLNSCELLMIETKTNSASYCFKEIAYNMRVKVSTVLETPKTNKLQILNLGGTDSKYIYTKIVVPCFAALNIAPQVVKITGWLSFIPAFMLTAFSTSDSFVLIVTLILGFHLIFIIRNIRIFGLD